MRFLITLSNFALAANAVCLDSLHKRQTVENATSPLDVRIEMAGNSVVKATVTNTGNEYLRVLRTGSFLQENSATEKLRVFQHSPVNGIKSRVKVPFDGIRLRIATTNLPDAAFTLIAPGDTITANLDMASMHDLSPGGTYDVRLEGALPLAEPNSTTLIGSIPYSSNLLSASVDGALAAKARKTFLNKVKRLKSRTTAPRWLPFRKRAELQKDCTGARGQATAAAVTNCADMAQRAAVAARTGPATKLAEFFKRSDNQTRARVGAVFDRVQKECATTTGGASDLHCTDVLDGCEDGVLAYTLPSQSVMVNCQAYFGELPAKETTCHKDDQQLTTLHEVTHLTQVADTDDYGSYGYEGVRKLKAEQNLNHADTYALYAAAIVLGC